MINSNKIRARIVELGMSNRQVAEAIGISRSALANYECGIRIPRDEIKEVLARYYGMTVGALFFNE